MQAWKRKAALDAVKSFIPFQPFLRRVKRTLSPYQTNPKNDSSLLCDGLQQLTALDELSIQLAGAEIIEIGTGWNPVLPLLYSLSGAKKITTVDQERLLDVHLARAALAYIAENVGDHNCPHRLAMPLPVNNLRSDKVTLDAFLGDFRIVYHAPFDFMQLPEGCADLIVSRAVLEHIPVPVLMRIFAHSHRVLRPGGVICHTIDMSDHWEHGDKTISRVNFLKYDGLPWKLTCLNVQNYQNRLRRFEYLSILKENNFEILSATGVPNAAARNDLASARINLRYRDVPVDELAILDTTIIARRL
jgi:SAM-dependent methyltransferase